MKFNIRCILFPLKSSKSTIQTNSKASRGRASCQAVRGAALSPGRISAAGNSSWTYTITLLCTSKRTASAPSYSKNTWTAGVLGLGKQQSEFRSWFTLFHCSLPSNPQVNKHTKTYTWREKPERMAGSSRWGQTDLPQPLKMRKRDPQICSGWPRLAPRVTSPQNSLWFSNYESGLR